MLRHAEGEHHKQVSDGIKGRLPGQRIMVVHRTGEDVHNIEVDAPGERRAAAGPVQVLVLDSPATNDGNRLNFNDQVNKAEILWALKCMESTYFYRYSFH